MNLSKFRSLRLEIIRQIIISCKIKAQNLIVGWLYFKIMGTHEMGLW